MDRDCDWNRPAKASRAFLISSAFNRSVIGILSAGKETETEQQIYLITFGQS